jgi:hypothetical protein
MVKITDERKVEIIAELRRDLPEGSTVYTTVHTVAQSGMSRTMTLFAVVNGEVYNLNVKAAQLGIGTRTKNDTLRLGGAGMDMGFHAVYTLSSILYREVMTESDAGYALNHRWL